MSEPEALLTAFDIFGDPLVKRYLDRQRVDDQAKLELEMVDKILGTETATPWHRAQALHRLVTGAAPADVTKALKQERQTVWAR